MQIDFPRSGTLNSCADWMDFRENTQQAIRILAKLAANPNSMQAVPMLGFAAGFEGRTSIRNAASNQSISRRT